MKLYFGGSFVWGLGVIKVPRVKLSLKLRPVLCAQGLHEQPAVQPANQPARRTDGRTSLDRFKK